MLVIISSDNLYSAPVGHIFSNDYPDTTEINFGPCFAGDSLVSEFTLENSSTNKFIIYGVNPTYSIYNYFANDPLNEEFRSFNEINTFFPIILQPNSQVTLPIQYRSDTNIIIHPTGYYNANLLIGYGKEPDTTVVLNRIFHLFAKKTIKYVDGYEDLLRFDSIYVNAPVGLTLDWRVKSTKKDSVQIDEQNFQVLSQQLTKDEFFPIFYEINPLFRKKSDVINWSISYLPRDVGLDSAKMSLKYHPLPKQYPDSVQEATVKVIGIGVKQDLRLISSNYNISGDTIFVGKQKSNSVIKIIGKIANLGNIPFNSTNEQVFGDNFSFSANVSQNLITNNKYLQPDSASTFSIDLTLKDRGSFTLRYEIQSDIAQRPIYYYPDEALKKVIYIVGVSAEPIIETTSDTLDFESIYYYLPSCPSVKDTSLILRNAGNDTLVIDRIEINKQVPTFAFSFDTNSLKILPNSIAFIPLHFEPIFPQNYSAELVLYNNSQKNPYIIYLKGNSTIPAMTSLHIDTLRGKPGSIIQVPIKVDSNVVQANEFEDTLYYNRSILHYVGYILENTAIEQPITQIAIKEEQSGRLAVIIKKPAKTRFKENKTLIILQFKVFLGNSKYTNISFNNPIFGNEVCNYALSLPRENISNGYFITDSICGIDLKAYPQEVVLENIYPNPANNKIKIDFQINKSADVYYQLFDNEGSLIEESTPKHYNEGSFQELINTEKLITGVYFLKVNYNNNYYITQFLIEK